MYYFKPSFVVRLFALLLPGLLFPTDAVAHYLTFNSAMTYTNVQPTGDTGSVANWIGAVFDADNIGGTGVNADGSPNNGTANDASTYVANNQPAQGQSFLTGSAANGYRLNSISVRAAGYSANNASGANNVYWDLNLKNGPIQLTINVIDGTNRTTIVRQCFLAGEVGNPGSGNSPNGAGTYLTFYLPVMVYLEPKTTYGFELAIGSNGSNYFEWLGTKADSYANGTAYHYSGSTITPLAGDHVFLADMTELPSTPAGFAHPGVVHTQADIDRMKAKVLASQEPWLSGYNVLMGSAYNNLGWPAYDVDYIIRGGTGDNYTRCQEDAQLMYTLALIWHLTGDTNYASRAVYFTGVWSGLQGLQGNSNASLAAGICGYLFAAAGDLLSTYPGWAEPDKQAYKDMMMRVFYPANYDFLWRHHGTFYTGGGNTHYRLNWDTCNMAAMAAIGILCDNRAVYEQAVDYYKNGLGNGNIRRAAWYVHPDGLGQGEEAGRDQGHNLGGWYFMAQLCQAAWNQGDDLWSFDNNRPLRVWEYNAKYNLWNDDVPYARHRNSDLSYTEGSVSGGGRGLGGYHQYELVYNHYKNLMGIAAPWSEMAAAATRPEPWPSKAVHPSQVDWFGLGTLTYSLDPTTNDIAPSGLRGNWSKNKIILGWWGSARATNYLVSKAATVDGPYIQIGAVTGPDLNFTDTNVVNHTTNYYIVTAQTPSGDLDSAPLRIAQELVSRYTFEGNVNDVVGTNNGTLHGGSTGLPGYAAGFGGGQAIDLDGVDDYVQLPIGVGNYQDITVSAWVNWDGGGSWQRIFDFGSDIEKTMFLTPSQGSGIRWGFTTTRGGNFIGDASYYPTSGSPMPVGTWTHVAVTLNGDVMTLYVNGVPASTIGTNDLIDPLFSQVFCYIGKSMYNADPLLNGRIDDFRIYNHALSGADVYELWGQSANHPPVFDSDPFNLPLAAEDVNYSAQSQSLAATDLDGGLLTYTKLAGPPWLTVAGNGALSGTPGNADVGPNYFVVRVTDPAGGTDDATLWITVTNANDPPTWTTDPIDGGTNLQGNPYFLPVAGYANDIDAGDVLVFSKVSGPAWLEVATNGVLTGIPGSSDAGANEFTLRVTDLAGAFEDVVLKVEVLPGTTVAYWNFEEGTTNTPVTGPAANGTYSGTLLDVSGNGYDASPFFTVNDNMKWTGTVPAATTPQNAATNTISLGNTGTSYFSTSTTGNGQTPDPNLGLHTWTPTAWTLEAAFRLGSLINAQGGGNITIVGRDGNTSGGAPLYFGTRASGSQAAVEFRDLANNDWNLTASYGFAINNWYALAATSDGSTLRLYVKNITGGDAHYTLLNTLSITSGTNSAMSTGSGDGGDWDPGNFSIGRGLYNGGHVDRIASGSYVDDVRLSNGALKTNQFLYSPPAPTSSPVNLAAVGGEESVSLSWDVVPEATSYLVKRSLTNGGPYAIVDSPTDSSFTDLGLINGTAYYYVVSAVGLGGESANSLQVLGRPVSLETPQVHVSGALEQIQIEWPFDHTGWRLETQTNSLGPIWHTVPGSASTNSVIIPTGGAAPISVFFRLVYP